MESDSRLRDRLGSRFDRQFRVGVFHATTATFKSSNVITWEVLSASGDGRILACHMQGQKPNNDSWQLPVSWVVTIRHVGNHVPDRNLAKQGDLESEQRK